MSKIGKYKGDLFRIHPNDDGEILLSCQDGQKAQKYGMIVNQGIGYYLTVPANEVEELFDEIFYRRKLFDLDIKYYKYLSNFKLFEKGPINDELRIIFKNNNINISNEATILKNVNWWIVDGKNQYTIHYENNELIVFNGGVI